MFKIKLLILLLVSLLLIGCSNKPVISSNSFQIGYIGGGADGAIFKNLLIANMQGASMYDNNSNFVIEASIQHNTSFYITNTNKTSDRQKIVTQLNIKISDNQQNCEVYSFNDEVSQFYIVASATVFTSNDAALEEIKINNSESLIKKFLFDLNLQNLIC